jgi:hypothetical protein
MRAPAQDRGEARVAATWNASDGIPLRRARWFFDAIATTR